MAGYDRYNRSQNILNSEINQQNINVDTLLNGLVRDFSRSYTSSFLPYEIPYMNQATDNTEFPYGYIPTKNSISRYQTVSSCIVRGILPGERPELTTMWTQLGNSASSVILPYFPINTIPNQANNTTLSDYSNNIKAELYYPETVNGWYIIDSYQLENSDYNLNAIWPNFRNFEENIFSSTSTNISTWNNTGYDIVDINNFINNNVSNLINFYSTTLNSGSIYQRPNVIADFSWTKENHQITFLDQSIHGPNINGSGWNWDFNDLYTSIDQDPIHTYTQSGNYFVTLLVEGIDGSTDIIYQPILIDDPVFYFQDTFINASPGDIVDIDIALDMGIDNNLNHFVLNINGFGDLTFNNYTINGLPTGWSSVSNIDNLDFTFLGIPPLENNNLLLTIQLDIPTDPSQEYYNLELNITDVGDLPLIAPYSQNNCIIYINNIGGGNGDLNSNGSTDLEDAFMLLQYLEGNIGLDNEQLVNADVNCDETVEVVDIAAILDFSISNISFLPDCSYSLSNLTDNIDYTYSFLPNNNIVDLSINIENESIAKDIKIIKYEFQYDHTDFPNLSINHISFSNNNYNIFLHSYEHIQNPGRIKLLLFGEIVDYEQSEIEFEISFDLNEDINFSIPTIQIYGHSTLENNDIVNQNSIPNQFELEYPFPNPFNPITNIRYGVPKQSDLSILVYDINGTKIKELYNGNQLAGYHSLIWDAVDQPSGLYFVKMTAYSFTKTQKLMLVK